MHDARAAGRRAALELHDVGNSFASDIIAAADIDDPAELDRVLFSFYTKAPRCAGDCVEELGRCKQASTKERVELLARCGG